ncbi:YjjG family noncanonical pyrimidine nucleotidase [Leeuwenhoekiella blandensis]|uniref:Haloacid dehalogenase-like hydrolase n=1 Tax=Leeuwenhoekiella blandensis (strain CECT 7118 / CCUG 51940 / KCTC 22103 / MED217) TaxID=398720 RepID=A3XQW9_LEEBM|nr:YjjG family noncanonical pyrimidine nucleotidase [Leeuwenhoekiella blandensis]EAQ48123.1 haloacid dehalogenase-like hydrolase [Leeuwenhoekiella blandensis MED217]
MTKLKNIQHVFFDLDHTLWDFDRNSKLAFEDIFKKNNISVAIDDFLEVYVPINFQYWKYYRESRITKEQLRYGRLKNSFKELGVAIDDFLIDRLSVDYIDHLPNHNHLFEGAIAQLSNLHKKYELHIITNGFQEVQSLKLQNSKIDHFFKTITSSESVGVKKPDARIFKHALELAAADPKKSVMIGDNYEADILGAQNMGLHTICFNYHKAKLPESLVAIDDLTEISNFL